MAYKRYIFIWVNGTYNEKKYIHKYLARSLDGYCVGHSMYILVIESCVGV